MLVLASRWLGLVNEADSQPRVALQSGLRGRLSWLRAAMACWGPAAPQSRGWRLGTDALRGTPMGVYRQRREPAALLLRTHQVVTIMEGERTWKGGSFPSFIPQTSHPALFQALGWVLGNQTGEQKVSDGLTSWPLPREASVALEILMGRGSRTPETPLPSHSASPLSSDAGRRSPPKELLVRSLESV